MQLSPPLAWRCFNQTERFTLRDFLQSLSAGQLRQILQICNNKMSHKQKILQISLSMSSLQKRYYSLIYKGGQWIQDAMEEIHSIYHILFQVHPWRLVQICLAALVAASFSLVMLYGRKAVVFLFAYKMTKEKNWLKLPWFAHTASAWWHAVSRISLSKRFVWAFSYKGCITAADAMYDDTAIFWTRRFIYRLPSCFWGLEMFFEIIQLFVRCLGRGRETDTNIHVRCLA